MTVALQNLSGGGLRGRHSPKHTHPICAFWDAFGFRHKEPRRSVGRSGDASLVSRLLKLCSPSAVFGRVVSVIIDALNRQARRVTVSFGPRSECVEVSDPRLANRYSSASVVVEAFPVRVRASTLHAGPDGIERAFLFPIGLPSAPVGEPGSAGRFRVQAPARFILAVAKALGRNNHLVSAVAAAKPRRARSSVRRSGYNDKARVAVAKAVDKNLFHGANLTRGLCSAQVT